MKDNVKPEILKVLIACEESQRVCIAFRKRGFEAYSNVYEEMMKLSMKERCKIWYMGGGHSKERSKTYEGIAQAMAQQWGDYLLGKTDKQLSFFDEEWG